LCSPQLQPALSPKINQEAELLLADMEIDPNDHPAEKELKLSVVDVYNRCVLSLSFVGVRVVEAGGADEGMRKERELGVETACLLSLEQWRLPI
jgi:hypothetical protein